VFSSQDVAQFPIQRLFWVSNEAQSRIPSAQIQDSHVSR
jgi:hypothetical protein